jgi:endoglucanase
VKVKTVLAAVAVASLAGPFGSQSVALAAAPSRPFGSHPVAYVAGSVLPSTQSARDTATASFYDQWKARFITPGCGSGEFVVNTQGDTSGMVVSEGQGYGMEIVPLMAGHDSNAQAVFDGLYRYFRAHPSIHSPDLMSWNQDSRCQNTDVGDSATDGDISIAYGLLLADRQWGSAGAINYLAEAKRVIAAIKLHEVEPTTHLTNLGDWAPPSSKYRFGTRPSDWMLDHFRAFQTATGDPFWGDVITATQNLITFMRATYAPNTGLWPDFIVNTNTTPAPPKSKYLESANDGNYSWNSCRVPWHIGTDYLVSGDSRSKTQALKMSSWISGATGGDPSRIVGGYTLDGRKKSNGYELSYAAPFGVGATVDASQQGWVNSIWNNIVGVPIAADRYYGNSLKMQAMLVLSNNYWLP